MAIAASILLVSVIFLRDFKFAAVVALALAVGVIYQMDPTKASRCGFLAFTRFTKTADGYRVLLHGTIPGAEALIDEDSLAPDEARSADLLSRQFGACSGHQRDARKSRVRSAS